MGAGKEAMSKKLQHIHKYQKVRWGKLQTIVWRCMITGCPHYKHEEFMLGIKSICHKCGRPFIMTKEKLRRDRPKCDACQHNQDPAISKLDDLLQGI